MQTRIGNLGFALTVAVALMLVAAACSNDGSSWGDARYTAEMRERRGRPHRHCSHAARLRGIPGDRHGGGHRTRPARHPHPLGRDVHA